MRWWVAVLAAGKVLCAQDVFLGAMGGIATISADARVEGSPPLRSSAYKPENGATAVVFGGHHFTDYFSAQVSYGWNRNAAVLSGLDLSAPSSVELPARVTMHTIAAEAMAYFRPRASRLRPYLSAGPTLAFVRAEATGVPRVNGPAIVPDARIRATKPGLRVAVGIDWRLHNRFALRYRFSETIQGNPIGAALTPRGERGLANFQNWWGVTWSF